MSQPSSPPRRRHTVAAVVYLLLTLFAVVAASSKPELWIAVILLGAYTTYLFRGGRWVVFFF